MNAVAYKTTDAIIEDLGSGFFSILVDESRDISIKEQMAIVLRYVVKKGIVTERFLGIVHVADTSALSLKAAIEFLFSKYALSYQDYADKVMMGLVTCKVNSIVLKR